MQVVPSDVGKVTPTIWDSYKEIIKLVEPKVKVLKFLDVFHEVKALN